MRTFASKHRPTFDKYVTLAKIRLFRSVYWLSSKMYRVVLAYIASMAIAIALYTNIEGWSLVDALWWSDVASLTIGYGDLAPKTDIGRLIAIPLQAFWVFYILPVIAGHVVVYLFKNLNIFTHHEQEWLFKSVRVIFDWMRWCVMSLQMLAQRSGIKLPDPPHIGDDGKPIECPDEPDDTDYDATLVNEAAGIRAK